MMTTTEIVTSIVLELVLVGALYFLYCYFKRNGIKNKILKNALNNSDEALVRSMLIDTQIARVKQHLIRLTGNAADTEQRREIYQTWLGWLNSEKDAWVGLEYDKTKGFWGLFEDKAMALIAKQDLPAPNVETPPAEIPAAVDSIELVALRKKVAEYQGEIDNLGRFRGLFFDLKGQLKDQQHDFEKLQLQLQQMLLSSENPNDQQGLKELNEHLKHKNRQLQNQLESINADFESLFAVATETSSTIAALPAFKVEHFEKVDTGIAKIKNVVAAQNLEIGEMNKMIHGLQIELELRDSLLNKMKDFEARTEEMDTVIEVLEAENQYLQGQVKSFQSTTRGHLYDLEDQVNSLIAELKEKEDARHKLQTKYNDLESEYLEVYEKLHAKK